ncbi:NEDD8 activating enzyme E1 subunit 1 [Martensiomyces pterosporus]|nr:NEDD8 activating enzyme E1 subunit 1 [Martensiomyces pterosporus]
MRTETDKAKLYDRQLRLWQESGQAALENACVCVFGSSALAAESLKNLVLPGIGRFVVVDDAAVDEQDVLTNFFVGSKDVGRPRAQCVVENLCELNPAVQGTAIVRSAEDALSAGASGVISSASLVIACGLAEHTVRQISEICWSAHTPLVCASTAGFAARLRTSVPEHAAVESHVGLKSDLRLLSPFPALRDYAEAVDLDSLDETDAGHVPYVIIILKALQRWAASSNSQEDIARRNMPIPYSSKQQIRELILQAAPAPGEENFQEAYSHFIADCTPYEIPGEVSQILDDPACTSVSAQSDKFWILAHALRRYVQSVYSQGELPLSGTIPDMKADTRSYIALQRIYKQKADQDKAEVSRHVHETLQMIGLPTDYVSAGEIDTFCKNAHRLRLLRCTPIHTELDSGPTQPSALSGSGALDHYVLFRASDAFLAKHARYPGAPSSSKAADSVAPGGDAANGNSLNSSLDLDDLVSADTLELSAIANGMLASWGVDSDVSSDIAAEFVRSGHCELHNIASMAGGLVSQEAIKLITHQYVPANNLCIVDGASARILVAKI